MDTGAFLPCVSLTSTFCSPIVTGIFNPHPDVATGMRELRVFNGLVQDARTCSVDDCEEFCAHDGTEYCYEHLEEQA